MAVLARLVLLSLCAGALSQYAEERAPRYIASGASEQKVAPTPVPILKQINKHNEDGSYTYGYEAADGSFKIETKSPTGEVKGKYGYKDDSGKLRVVEYGANKYGFQPAGEGITVAPPTLVDETKEQEGSRPPKQQGGRSQYRAPVQAPVQDYDYEEPAPAPPPRRPAPSPQYRQQSAPTPPRPAFFAGAAPAPATQDSGNFFNPAPQPRQQYKQKQDFRPQAQLHTQPFPSKPQIEYSQNFGPQQFAPAQQQQFAPQQQQFTPAPRQQYSPAPQQFSQPQFSQQREQPFSMLDQLLKEYALPQGGAAPLHDITFGSY